MCRGCPTRAEVLYSERPAKDATHIAQVIGRMVRQPLAHRIATDDALNLVSCYLPLFDRAALASIKEELEGNGKGISIVTPSAIVRSLKEGVGLGYYKYRAARADPGVSKLDVRIEVAALLRVPRVVDRIEEAATEFVREQLAKFAAEIANTTGDVRDKYRKVQEQTSRPEALTIELHDNEKAATRDANGDELPRFPCHLYADDKGMFPANLNDWETEIITVESARPSFVAWYRNPAPATPNSLRIAYENDAGAWASLQVDFIVISRRDDGTVAASIVDPHGDYLADAKAKLLALADFAEAHGDSFVRILSITAISEGSLRMLDLKEPDVRAGIRAFTGGKVTALYEGSSFMPYG